VTVGLHALRCLRIVVGQSAAKIPQIDCSRVLWGLGCAGRWWLCYCDNTLAPHYGNQSGHTYRGLPRGRPQESHAAQGNGSSGRREVSSDNWLPGGQFYQDPKSKKVERLGTDWSGGLVSWRAITAQLVRIRIHVTYLAWLLGGCGEVSGSVD